MKKSETTKKVRELKAGEFFKMNQDSPTVFVMGVLRRWTYQRDYDHQEKKYTVTKFTDSNVSKMIKGDKEVFVNFTF